MAEINESLDQNKDEDNSEEKKEKSVKVEKEKCKDDSCVSEWRKENSSIVKKGILLNKLSSSDTNLSKRSTLSKIFWDPWTKIKGKKKNKRKNDYFDMKMDYDSSDSSAYNASGGNFGEYSDSHTYSDLTAMHEQYGEPYQRKRVKFQSDVHVIHYDSNQILGDTVEPLKKEHEQQIRNIQLRKEKAAEALDVMRTKSKKSVTNYMSAWRKK